MKINYIKLDGFTTDSKSIAQSIAMASSVSPFMGIVC